MLGCNDETPDEGIGIFGGLSTCKPGEMMQRSKSNVESLGSTIPSSHGDLTKVPSQSTIRTAED